MKRRDFFKNITIATAGLAVAPSIIADVFMTPTIVEPEFIWEMVGATKRAEYPLTPDECYPGKHREAFTLKFNEDYFSKYENNL